MSCSFSLRGFGRDGPLATKSLPLMNYIGVMASILMLSFVKPPLPGWAWVVLLVGGAIAFVVDRIRNR